MDLFFVHSKDGINWQKINTFPVDYSRSIGEILFDSYENIYILEFNYNDYNEVIGDILIRYNKINGNIEQISNNIPNKPMVSSIVLDKNNNLFAGTSDGKIYFSTNTGNTWELFIKYTTINKNEDVPLENIKTISALAIDKTGYLIIGTNSGLFISEKTTDIILDNTKNKSFSFSPNPASDYIEISVGVYGDSSGEIGIYDVFGRKSHLTPALSEGEGVRIDVSGLVPGLYILKFGDRVARFLKI